MIRRLILGSVLSLAAALQGAGPGDSVVVVYNSGLGESRSVAEHYAARRNVPAGQVIGLALPTNETMSRAEYREQLEEPLRKYLLREQLFRYAPMTNSGQTNITPVEARIRYVVLCFGVPLRIAEDPTLSEPDAVKFPEAWRRNGAAVDTELCTLPVLHPGHGLAGPVFNMLYGTTRASAFDPTNGVLMVTRLDGPSAAVAAGLVDKALSAETNGLWGRAYFDLQGLTNTDYKKGDDWIRASSYIARDYGFEVEVDERPETFPAGFPMSQIALYAGWYSTDANGPFAQPKVEFMPGAFAYHLHSFSAQTLRSTTQRWCGPLLAKGVTATMGCIDEPYLDGTPVIAMFFERWVRDGFTFGEAAYACQRVLSWQTTVIGDPLYRPFGKIPRQQREELIRRHSRLIEWFDLLYADKSLQLGLTVPEVVKYLRSADVPQDSAVLTEKLAELYEKEGLHDLSIETLRKSLKLDPTPQQRIRLTLTLGEKLAATGQGAKSLALYETFLKKNPDYPGALALYKRMKELADTLHQRGKAEQYAAQIARLGAGK
jgi:uncharacterized protein (TIGR03790 family)